MKSFTRSCPKPRSGFTLIELLVVVTIIVVLLSLLVPAIDQAVYQAELTVCASRLHAHAATATVYAMNHKRHYLFRGGNRGGTYAWRPDYLALTTETDKTLDDRPAMRTYMSINKMAACPMVKELDLDGFPPPGNPLSAILIYNSYDRWYGFRYIGDKSLRGMLRIGDRLQWRDDDGRVRSFSAMVSDIDSENWTNGWTNNSHPDRNGFTALTTVTNAVQPYIQGYTTYSYWGRWGVAPDRGPIDRSFAFEDGSVLTYNDVFIDDPRMVNVGVYNTSTTADSATQSNWLPER